MYFVLFYDVVDDYIERRGEFRAQHLALAEAARERGDIVLAGALDDPPDGAVLVFEGDDPSVAEAFAGEDPYVQNGLVTKWRVRKWNVVVGGRADPVLPS